MKHLEISYYQLKNQGKQKCHFILLALSLIIILFTSASAQVPDTTISYEPNGLWLRIDVESMLQGDFGQVTIKVPGHYRISAHTFYNSGWKQLNESYYLRIRLNDGNTYATTVDANAGPYKVVPDDSRELSHHEDKEKHIVWQDAGLFFLPAGTHTIEMHHYLTIAETSPEFINPRLGRTESVMVRRMNIIYEPIVDGAVTLHAKAPYTIGIGDKNFDVVYPGESFQYELVVKNLDEDVIFSSSLTNLLPEFVTVNDFSLQPSDQQDSQLAWDLPELAASDSLIITFDATVNNTMPEGLTPLISQAMLDVLNDQNLINNFDLNIVYAYVEPDPADSSLADLELEIFSETDSVFTSGADFIKYAKPGEDIEYKIKIHNKGPDTAKIVRLTNIVPSFVDAHDFSVPPINPNASILTWEFAQIEPLAELEITYLGRVDTSLNQNDFPLINNVMVLAKNDTLLTNNFAEDTVRLAYPGPPSPVTTDIAITHHEAITEQVVLIERNLEKAALVGTRYSYTITAQNLGEQIARNVKLYNSLPDSVLPDSNSITISGPIPELVKIHKDKREDEHFILWQFDEIQGFEVVNISFDVLVADSIPDTPFELFNEVGITAVNDTDYFNNFASSTVYAISDTSQPVLADISVAQKIETDSIVVVGEDTLNYVDEGGEFRVRIVVENEGDVDAQNVRVYKILPDSVTAIGFEPQPSTVIGDTLFWEISVLPANSDTVMEFTEQVAPLMPVGTNLLINEAFVEADNEDPDNLLNNVSIDTVYNTVEPEPLLTDLDLDVLTDTDSLVVVGDDTLNYVDEGGEFRVRIVVENEGDVDAQNVRVYKVLPDSVTATGFEPQPSSISGDTLFWEISVLPAHSDTVMEFTEQVAPLMPVGTNLLINETFVEADNENPDSLLNNVSIDTVYNIVEPEPLLTDLDLDVLTDTDSVVVVGEDTLNYVDEGEPFRVRIVVENVSDVDAEDVRVYKVLPDSVTAIGFEPQPSTVIGDTLFWEISVLPAHSDTVMEFTELVAPLMPVGTNLLINEAFVEADNEDPDSLLNNVSIDTVYNTVEPEPLLTDLELDVLTDTDSVVVVVGDDTLNYVDEGGEFRVRIMVENEGDVDAQNVRVYKVLPDSVTATGFEPQPSTVRGDTLFWEISVLSANSDTVMEFTELVAPFMPVGKNLLINKAFVEADNENPDNLLNNVSIDTVYNTVEPEPLLTDLELDVLTDTDSVVVVGEDTLNYVDEGGEFRVRIVVENISDVDAENVQVYKVLPDSVTAIGFEPEPNLVVEDTLFWEISVLSANSDTVMEFTELVAPQMPVGTNLLINEVFVEADNEDPDSLLNNVSIDTVYNTVEPEPLLTDLELDVLTDTDSVVVVGDDTLNYVDEGEPFTVRIVVENESDVDAENVRVYKVLPDSVTATGFEPQPSSVIGDTLFWEISFLPAHSDTVMEFTELVAPLMPVGTNLLINETFVEADNENPDSLLNNVSIDTVYNTVEPEPLLTDLDLDVLTDTDSVVVVGDDTLNYVDEGGEFRVRIVVENEGDVDAENVLVYKVLPDSVTATGFEPQPNLVVEDTLFWEISVLSANSDTVMEFTEQVAPQMPVGTNLLINEVFVEAGNEDPDNLLNNVSIDTVYNVVEPEPLLTDLELDVLTDTDSIVVVGDDTINYVDEGEPFRVRIVVENDSDVDAQNVRVYKVLPDSVTAIGFEPQPSTISGDTLFWDISVLPALSDTVMEFTEQVAPQMPMGTNLLINEAFVEADNEDPHRLFNNVSVDTVYNIVQPGEPDITVHQIAITDSFEVVGDDTLKYAKEGEVYTKRIVVKNEGTGHAENIVVKDVLPDSLHVVGYDPAPEFIDEDSLKWVISNLPANSTTIINVFVSVPRHMPIGTNLLINRVYAFVENEDPDKQFNNTSIDTVYNVVAPPEPIQPEIEASPPLVGVGDSVYVRVRVPDEVATYDLWVHLPTGQIDSSYADDFIWRHKLVPNEWLDVLPAYLQNHLLTDLKQEQVTFEIRTRDFYGRLSNASVSVIIHSSNYLVLDRNVFQADNVEPLGIKVKLSSRRVARLDVYDITGKHIDKLVEEVFPGGWTIHFWDGRTHDGTKVGSGVYLVTLRSGEFNDWKKFILVR